MRSPFDPIQYLVIFIQKNCIQGLRPNSKRNDLVSQLLRLHRQGKKKLEYLPNFLFSWHSLILSGYALRLLLCFGT